MRFKKIFVTEAQSEKLIDLMNKTDEGDASLLEQLNDKQFCEVNIYYVIREKESGKDFLVFENEDAAKQTMRGLLNDTAYTIAKIYKER